MSADSSTIWEDMAAALEKSPDYRVSRRLTFDALDQIIGANVGQADPSSVHVGVYLDVETTGLDSREHEIVELCLLPFLFDKDGIINHRLGPYHSYREPAAPIPPEMTEIHGVTDAMVKDQFLDHQAIEQIMAGAVLTVAHHAEFDRAFCEALPTIGHIFKDQRWACSMSQPPWKKHGIEGRRLEYIVAKAGRFYEAHHAIDDCMAGLFALTCPLAGRPVLAHLLDATRRKTFRVHAHDAPKRYKDLLKARGYRWSPGDEGRPFGWHKEIPFEDEHSEWCWLQINVYSNKQVLPATFTEVTAVERFTLRG